MYALIGLIVGVGAALVYLHGDTLFPSENDPNVYHIHANFAMFINGQKFDFAQEKYMESETQSLSKYVHLHDLDGETIHFHAQNISIGTFLHTLGFEMEEETNCVTLDTGEKYCDDDTRTWKVWVNGTKTNEGLNYIPSDLDRVLISYGDETNEQLLAQMARVNDTACIQSEKCPERGTPSEESSCAGSGECGVGNIPVGN